MEPLLSKTSQSDDLGHVWTYFLVNTSDGAAGKNIHIQLTSDVENFYELFIRFGGLPFLEIWDYYYLNQTLSSTSTNHSIFKLYDSDGKKINIYILYAREGPWIIGLRNPVFISSTPLPQTTMSISVEECVNQCSKRGTCQSYEDASGSTSYRLHLFFFFIHRCSLHSFSSVTDCHVFFISFSVAPVTETMADLTAASM